jgi:hypothetical protein
MASEPQPLFCARRAGPAVLIGPVFDRKPHYQDLVDELLRRHADEIRAGIARGLRYGVEVCHDGWCPALTGGTCTCDCMSVVAKGCNPRRALTGGTCTCDCLVNPTKKGDPEEN